ncbi:MAG: hypothetical protein GF384_08970 [Elusimicrobia bacterium]|nr:hypothetical protein [Elusimicrobiota bacterium]
MDMPKPPKLPINPKKGPGLPPPIPPSGRSTPVPPKPGLKPPQTPQQTGQDDLSNRINRLEERSSGVADSRKALEDRIKQLEQRLQEEKEKSLLENLRSKEEAALSSNIDVTLKDMQEKLRREQEIQELKGDYSRAQEQIQVMEDRLRSERETWVKTLQDHMSGREQQEQEMEVYFNRKLAALEQTWREEKNNLVSRLHQTEEALVREQKRLEVELDKKDNEYERIYHERLRQLEDAHRAEKEQALQYRRERDVNAEKLAEHEQEFVALKAQMALMQSQMKLEKEKINQVWKDTIRAKDEELEAFKKALADSSTEADIRVKQAEDNVARTMQHSIDNVNRLREEERQKAAHTESDLRLQMSELNNKLSRLEEEAAPRKQADDALQAGFAKEHERLTAELTRAQELHRSEQKLWQQAMRDIENKLTHQKHQWEQRLTEMSSELKNTKIQLEQTVCERDSVKEKFWNERDSWGQIAQAKDDQIQDMYEQMNQLSGRIKELENRLIADKEKMARTREELNLQYQQSFSRMEKENREWAEKLREHYEQQMRVKEEKLFEQRESVMDDIRSKDQEIALLKADLGSALEVARGQLQDEFQEMLAQAEKEHNEWMGNVKKQHEQASAIKEKRLHNDIEMMRKKMGHDLEMLEREHQSEKESLRQMAANKDEEFRKLNEESRKLNEECASLSAHLREKDVQIEVLEEKRRLLETGIKSHEETYHDKLAELEKRIEQDTMKLEQKETELDELRKVMEQPHVQEQPRGFLSRTWAALHKPVICISFRKLF